MIIFLLVYGFGYFLNVSDTTYIMYIFWIPTCFLPLINIITIASLVITSLEIKQGNLALIYSFQMKGLVYSEVNFPEPECNVLEPIHLFKKSLLWASDTWIVFARLVIRRYFLYRCFAALYDYVLLITSIKWPLLTDRTLTLGYLFWASFFKLWFLLSTRLEKMYKHDMTIIREVFHLRQEWNWLYMGNDILRPI